MESEVTIKMQPNDIVAEQAVLGSMLKDQDAVTAAIEVLKEQDFYRNDHKEIFGAMYDIYNSGGNIDMVTVQNELVIRGVAEKIGGFNYLTTIIDSVPTTSNIESYVKIVEEKATIRGLIKSANDILKVSYAGNENAETVVELAEKSIFNVLQNRNSRGYDSLKEILMLSFDRLEDMFKNKRKLAGLETGFIDLDKKISGLKKTELLIIAARPAMGKTSFVLNLATSVAMKSRIPVMIFSLEMGKEQMTNRILCGESEVDSMKFQNADLTNEEWLKLGEASSRLTDIPIFIDDTPGLSSVELRAKCRKAKLEKNIGLVIIDYLQLMEAKTKSPSRQQEISEISRSLKILAKELDIPVVALSQLSRATESRTDHKPMLSDLRESGAIEQDADIVMFLHREDYYNPETEKKNIAEVIIAKNRSGSTGSVELAWIGQYTKFGNLYREG